MDRLSADDYYRQSLEILGDWGSEGLTIAALCERLGVTKGSFYHHFGAMPAFVTQLLTFWETEHADALTAAAKSQPDATLRLATLADFMAGLPHASEAAIRAWGRSNPEVAEVVSRVDRRRDRQFADSIAALGVDRADARMLGRLAVSLVVGVQQREQPVDVRRLRQMLAEVTRLVVSEADPKLAARLTRLTG